MTLNNNSGYAWGSEEFTYAHDYLLPKIDKVLNEPSCEKRLFEFGCGNGSVANHLVQSNWQVIRVVPSVQGIERVNCYYPDIQLSFGSAYDNLKKKYGSSPAILSLELVYAPRDYAPTLYSLVEERGVAVISTPYHGYLKNLVLTLTGKMYKHFTALWYHDHIKFWSIETLTALLEEAGFVRMKNFSCWPPPRVCKINSCSSAKK